MKKIILSIATIALFSNANTQTLTWGEEIIVADATQYGKTRPRIVLTDNNTPLVMWTGGTASQPIYTSRWNGSSFDTPVQVTPNGVDPAAAFWQGADIAARGNTVFISFKAQPENSSYIYTQKSIDGGVTWQDTVRVDNGIGPLSRFPAVDIGPSGNPAVMFMEFEQNFTDPEYVITNSSDGGNTYNSAVIISSLTPGEVCDCCPASMINEGSRQTGYYRSNSSDLRDTWVSVSNDGGSTFNNAADIDPTNWIVNYCPSSGPEAMIKGDSTIVTWMSGESGNPIVWIGTANLQDLNPGFNAAIVPASGGMQNYPQIAGNQDTIGVVWQGTHTQGDDAYLSWSVTGAAGVIGSEEIINDSLQGSQDGPDIEYANGVFHMIWQDNANLAVKYRKATITEEVGIDRVNKTNNFSVYPNPANDILYIQTNKEFDKISVLDVLGKEVMSEQGNNSREINIANLQPGAYNIVVLDEGRNLGSSTFIKK